jgi:hypothetical protein
LCKFTLYEGKWIVRYEKKYTHEYVILADGSLTFDRCVSPDGTVFVQKDQQRARLVRQGTVVLVPFAGATILERFTLEGERLMVDRFHPSSLYPRNPNNRGEGVREKP